jgi:hypothetical protein
METKCLSRKNRVKMKERKPVILSPKTVLETTNETVVQVVKKPWKKPVLYCGKDIGFFGDIQGQPPDDFS